MAEHLDVANVLLIAKFARFVVVKISALIVARIDNVEQVQHLWDTPGTLERPRR